MQFFFWKLLDANVFSFNLEEPYRSSTYSYVWIFSTKKKVCLDLQKIFPRTQLFDIIFFPFFFLL